MIHKDLVGNSKLDYPLFSLFLTLIGLGWLMIYAAGFKFGYETMEWSDFMMKTPVGKQTLFIGVASLLILIIFSIDAKFWRIFAYPIYGFALFLLVAVLIFGKEINGNKAWFSIGGFGFQPVEIGKLGTALALASYLSAPSVKLRDRRAQLTVLSLLMAPMSLVLLQPDVGSMLVFLSFGIMLYREGLTPIPYIVGFGLAVVFTLSLLLNNAEELITYFMVVASAFFAFSMNDKARLWLVGVVAIGLFSLYALYYWHPQIGLGIAAAMSLALILVHTFRGRFKLVLLAGGGLVMASALVFTTTFAFNNILRKHQQERINVWLHPDKCDPRGVAYNLIHSKMAIGAGGFKGKGFLEGTMTRLSFVPEQHTDFIFCTVGEEHGFIGVVAVVAIFIAFLIRIVIVAERQRSNFVRLYGYGLAGIFFMHFFVNVGMTMGVMPVIGIPLPFISAGGSSLLGFTAMLGIYLRLDSARNNI